ncbi:MAG: DUF779 domain-containing protein [Zoogloea sp.]|uniref:DUF779 domain-containing protein n=1 Tax=Zoogloea sp. TaxID=49181 RepID=UPI00260204C0|nr:DUF779 domain-containing protein [Zoogloea sp.]MDD2988823.1 DUF779 domain-containing protein [Zoogloea sp.]
MVDRITATEAALQFIDELRADFGPLLFLLSGGCCDGSVPNCYKVGEILPGQTMILLGQVGGADFYLGHQEFQYYENSQLILDTQPGNGGDFSLDCGRGKAFVTRSRLFSDAELATLKPIDGA